MKESKFKDVEGVTIVEGDVVIDVTRADVRGVITIASLLSPSAGDFTTDFGGFVCPLLAENYFNLKVVKTK